MRNFSVATFSGIQASVASANPTGRVAFGTIWGTCDLVPDQPTREVLRPREGVYQGVTTRGNLDFPSCGLWVGGGKDVTTIMLSRGAVQPDPTLVSWMQEAGIAGKTKTVTDLVELAAYLRSEGRLFYAPDTYGKTLEGLTVNSAADCEFVSSKGSVEMLVGGYCPYQLHFPSMFSDEVDQAYEDVLGTDPEAFVVLKMLNIEHGGMGVKICRSKESFLSKVNEVREYTRVQELCHEIILQRGVPGKSRSFTLFLPGNGEFWIAGITDQLTCPVTGRDMGNRMYPVEPQYYGALLPMMQTLADNVMTKCPQAFGFLMCDFMETPSGQCFMIDPGLRPSAATSAVMAMLWIKENSGTFPYMQNTCKLLGDGPRVPNWAALCERIDKDLTDPEKIFLTHRAALPFGICPTEGTGRLLIAASCQEDYAAVEAEVLRDLHAAMVMDEAAVPA